MNVLKTFDRLRPNDEFLDEATRERVWSDVVGSSTRRARSSASPTDAGEISHLQPPTVVAIGTQTQTVRRRVALIGAAALVVVGLGGVAFLGAIGDLEADPADVEVPRVVGQAPQMVGMVLGALPDGLALTHPPVQPSIRSEPSSYQIRVWGALDDPSDPTRMIRAEYAQASAMAISCHSFLSLAMPDGAVAYTASEWTDSATPIAGSTAFAVADTTGSFCTGPNDVLQAGWFTGDIGVNLFAGSAVTSNELVELAQSLKSVAPTGPLDARPSVDLVSDPLPLGRTALVGDDVPFVNRITESSWVATTGGVDGAPGQLLVQTWSGVDQEGVYTRLAPEAERTTIRGHVGYQYTSKQRTENGPIETLLWWMETPGLVVSVRSTEHFELDELKSIIDQLVAVDAAGYTAFIES